jgi:CRISPR-associated protein Cmr5
MSAADKPAAAERQTLDQRRARHAWERVEEQDRGEKERAKEYAREARKLPTRIMASGLGQALVFLHAKAKDKKRGLASLLKDLTDWVIGQRLGERAKVKESLLESVVQGDSAFLRRATDETLAYLQWLNRFAEGKGLTDGEEAA